MKHTIEVDWITQVGLCAVVIKTPMGHRCGYVGVTASHKLFGVNYDDVCGVRVHGGLTFSDGHDDYPVNNKGDIWWFGFDTGHSFDLYHPKSTGYCVTECENMAHDLIHVAYKLAKKED